MSVAGYFCLNGLKRYRLGECFLLGMSLWFYGYFNICYLPIMLISILGNWGFSCLIAKNGKDKIKKLLLFLAVAINIGSIFYFKYYDFFIDNINRLFKTNFNLLNLVLPLGISFFTFQQISFQIDHYRENVKYDFLQYALFVSFFPQLVAGPIVTHDEIIPQFADRSRRTISLDNIGKGIISFTFGLSKKVLIADAIGNVANCGFSNIAGLDTTNAVLVMLAYTFQIYFDFSGYSDMAVGIGYMFNIELPSNFDSPYKSCSINEFWKKWHMTLTRFLRNYIYIPLGGNRKGRLRVYANIFIVYLFSGLWHGANWTFILWGGYMVWHVYWTGCLAVGWRMFIRP